MERSSKVGKVETNGGTQKGSINIKVIAKISFLKSSGKKRKKKNRH